MENQYNNVKDLNGVALIVAIIFAFILPPAAVLMKRGDFDLSFLFSLLFTVCGWILAPIHAFWVLFGKKD
jgi:uncharacterized membrane protein YqaE (UPF0057 family)